MITMAIGSAIYLVALQAAVNVPRNALVACLQKAETTARVEKIKADAFAEYARGVCAAESTKFRDALIAFDVKNGIARKRAADDADLQVDDYVDGSTNYYRRVMAASGERG